LEVPGTGAPRRYRVQMSRRLFPGKRRPLRAREQTDPKVFATRHRFLLVLLLVQVPALAVVGLITGVPTYEIVIASLILVVMAVIGMTSRTQGMAAGAVSLGLVTAAGIVVRYLEGSTESQFSFLLALVAISFYQEWRLVLAGFIYVAGFQIFNFAVLYREAYVQRYGVAHLALPVVFLTLTLVLVALLVAGWRLASRITVPLLSPQLFFLIVVSTIHALQSFGQIHILTKGDSFAEAVAFTGVRYPATAEAVRGFQAASTSPSTGSRDPGRSSGSPDSPPFHQPQVAAAVGCVLEPADVPTESIERARRVRGARACPHRPPPSKPHVAS